MNFQSKINDLINRDLILVEKPGRYVGGEYNQIFKKWDDVNIHVALAFPDIYDVGMSNLGLAILYDEINKRNDALAERVFSPWKDMEILLKEKSIPIFSLENKVPIKDFDLIGFTLPYETLYTNVLNILDLGGIPVYSEKRSDIDPIIIAGGHACYNPEPMHAFIDAFVIGEGEEIIHEILDCIIFQKQINSSRDEIISILGGIDGIYIPKFFQDNYTIGNTLSGIHAYSAEAKLPVKKRIVKKLPDPIINFLVPNINTVHNRIVVEVMRGCSRGCRFCHAGFVIRPVRERSVESVMQAIKAAAKNTGLADVSLLSLSISDYSKIKELASEVAGFCKAENLSFSLPSLRIESFSSDLMEGMSSKRKGNFTIAPESGSERIRLTINKAISDDDLLRTVENIHKLGWQSVKLYFMIGFPGETIADVEKIIHLCKKVHSVGKKYSGNRSRLHVSINTLIPKPHTPFQWISMDDMDSINTKYQLIIEALRKTDIKIDWSKKEMSLLEAWLSRGDRRLSEVIYKAWENGASFDAWHDQLNFDAWESAFKEIGIDPLFYSHRERKISEVLPWDHIEIGVNKSYLISEYEKSKKMHLTPDCNQTCSSCGIQKCFEITCSQLRLNS